MFSNFWLVRLCVLATIVIAVECFFEARGETGRAGLFFNVGLVT